MSRVRRSPVAAWAAYGAIGTIGTLALVLIACDGVKKANDDRPKLSVKQQVVRPVAPPTDDASEAVAPPSYSVHADLGAAFAHILRDRPRVLGVGELHVRTDKGPMQSALSRFSAEAMPALGAQVSDLVIETWIVDPACKTAGAATQRVETAMKRPESTRSEIGGLIGIIKQNGIKAHVMRLTCDDLAAVAPPSGVDAALLLDVVTRELGRVSRSALRYRDERAESRPLIVVYGGALHNDLYPYKSTAQWSYAPALDEATGGRFVEVDLYLPELVEGHALYEDEAWYPLLARAPHDKNMLIESATHSWLAILPRA
jgi:hypothetical protein